MVTSRATARRSRRRKLLWSPLAILLVLLMVAGSLAMWIGLALGLIWLASALTGSAHLSPGAFGLIAVGLPIGVVAIGMALGALDRAHGRLTGRMDDGRRHAVWLQSMRDQRPSAHTRHSVLDTVMIASLLLALVAGGTWIAVVGSPLPR